MHRSGVVDGLLEAGVILPGVTPLAGLSGGAFTSVATTLGLDGLSQKDFWQARGLQRHGREQHNLWQGGSSSMDRSSRICARLRHG